MKTISFYTGKGGVGKSTLAINIAGYFASKGYSVCVVDEDKQQTLIDIYKDNLENITLRNKAPAKGFDIVIRDHHPTHDSIALGDLVVCPIEPSRYSFESYKRSRVVIGNTPHILVVNKWQRRIEDDLNFIAKLRALCSKANTPFFDILKMNVIKRAGDKGLTLFALGHVNRANEARATFRRLGGLIEEGLKL